jgi:hypothetical protein
MHETPVEPQLIRWCNPRTERRYSSVDREATGADPGLRFAP